MAVDWTPLLDDFSARLFPGPAGRHPPKFVKRKWRTIKGEVGRKSLSREERRALDDGLRERGLHVHPRIDEADPGIDTMLMFRTRDEARERFRPRLPSEDALEHMIAALMPDMPGLRGVELVARQWQLGGGSHIPDLIGRKKLHGGRRRWYVIEVEHGDGHGESVQQVLRYARALEGELDDGGKPYVRADDEITLVVVTQDPHDAAATLEREAEAHGWRAKWLVVRIDVTDELASEGTDLIIG